MHLRRQSITSFTTLFLITLRSLLGLSTIITYKPLSGNLDLFVHYLAGVRLPMALPELLSKPQRRFKFNRHSLTASAVLLAGGGL
jgi:hypothetical protein